MVELKRVPIGEADPYLLFGLLGKQVIHPGGHKATKELLGLAALAPGQTRPDWVQPLELLCLRSSFHYPQRNSGQGR